MWGSRATCLRECAMQNLPVQAPVRGAIAPRGQRSPSGTRISGSLRPNVMIRIEGGEWAEGGERAGEAQGFEHLHRMRAELQAGAALVGPIAAFEDVHRPPAPALPRAQSPSRRCQRRRSGSARRRDSLRRPSPCHGRCSRLDRFRRPRARSGRHRAWSSRGR